jgi:hypothetical protein
LIAVSATLAFGCEKNSSAETEGLPVASDWSAPSPMASDVPGHEAGGHGSHGRDPHAGMDMGGDPHAGMDMGGDPHAGMDMGMGGHGGDPHAGMDMGGDPRMAMIQPPDPDRPIDESKFLTGTITASRDVADKIKPGAILFISAKPVNPVTGEIIGGPLAAERIDIKSLPIEFKLSERNAMSAGTRLDGDVLIHARVDGDGDAITKEPGDVTGELRAKVPADKLSLVLENVLR